MPLALSILYLSVIWRSFCRLSADKMFRRDRAPLVALKIINSDMTARPRLQLFLQGTAFCFCLREEEREGEVSVLICSDPGDEWFPLICFSFPSLLCLPPSGPMTSLTIIAPVSYGPSVWSCLTKEQKMRISASPPPFIHPSSHLSSGCHCSLSKARQGLLYGRRLSKNAL